ncbi:hypothetical protein KQ51_01160 [Candidatus Izimaplasma bacterium HR1]|jgi:hypothetical protein|uniref:hypothetical protein n=1 Tax=Candidatus Izimoplasma sp. HR1 TaxID=1541959 RepID=UPI0004F7A9E4|nr:hypothetical protein KQ51_01160 [Candidatus Izimaplasma bacterium HR1]
MSKLEIKNIFKTYKKLDILSSFLTALLFFAIIAGIILIPTIQMIYLYIPYVEYFLIGIYISLSLTSVYFNKIFVDTLKTYQVSDLIDYDKFKVRCSTVMTLIIFIIVFVVYIFLH